MNAHFNSNHFQLTSADRIFASSRSDAEQVFFRPASIGLQNNCRNEASDEKIPGFTNSDNANNSYFIISFHFIHFMDIPRDHFE